MGRRALAHSRLATAAAVLAGSLCAAPASAYVKGLVVVSGTSPSNSSSPKSRLASCGGGPSGAFGGAAFVFPASANLGLNGIGQDSYTVFVARATETDSLGTSWALAVRAFCGTFTPTAPPAGGAGGYIKGIELVRGEGSSNSEPVKSKTVSCPSGKVVIAGGARIDTTSSDVALTSIQRVQTGRAWRAIAQEVDATGSSWKLAATAVCANVTTETATADYVNAVGTYDSTTTASSNPTQSRTYTCPAGRYVAGGGATVLGAAAGDPPPSDVVITASEPKGNGPLATEWTATARETDPTGSSWRLRVKAVCVTLNGGPPA
jgi:hypothetical protein